MTHPKILTMSVTVAALSLGFSLQPHPRPFWESNTVIAAEETAPSSEIQTNDAVGGANNQKAAKMGQDEGTQTGEQSNPPESDTQKIDQPPRKNPTTGD